MRSCRIDLLPAVVALNLLIPNTLLAGGWLVSDVARGLCVGASASLLNTLVDLHACQALAWAVTAPTPNVIVCCHKRSTLESAISAEV